MGDKHIVESTFTDDKAKNKRLISQPGSPKRGNNLLSYCGTVAS